MVQVQWCLDRINSELTLPSVIFIIPNNNKISNKYCIIPCDKKRCMIFVTEQDTVLQRNGKTNIPV